MRESTYLLAFLPLFLISRPRGTKGPRGELNLGPLIISPRDGTRNFSNTFLIPKGNYPARIYRARDIKIHDLSAAVPRDLPRSNNLSRQSHGLLRAIKAATMASDVFIVPLNNNGTDESDG